MLKPQDVLVVLKIAALGSQRWTYPSLATALALSLASVHESVQRAVASGLVNLRDRRIVSAAVQEFLVHGLRYVFPAERGRTTRGMPTADAAPVLRSKLARRDELPLVWPYAKGTVRGEALAPLHSAVPVAAIKDAKLYALLALVDTLRAGSARERSVAASMLGEMLGT